MDGVWLGPFTPHIHTIANIGKLSNLVERAPSCSVTSSPTATSRATRGTNPSGTGSARPRTSGSVVQTQASLFDHVPTGARRAVGECSEGPWNGRASQTVGCSSGRSRNASFGVSSALGAAGKRMPTSSTSVASCGSQDSLTSFGRRFFSPLAANQALLLEVPYVA